jgi:hypothetical protein
MLPCIFTSFKQVQPHLNMDTLSQDGRKICPEREVWRSENEGTVFSRPFCGFVAYNRSIKYTNTAKDHWPNFVNGCPPPPHLLK